METSGHAECPSLQAAGTRIWHWRETKRSNWHLIRWLWPNPFTHLSGNRGQEPRAEQLPVCWYVVWDCDQRIEKFCKNWKYEGWYLVIQHLECECGIWRAHAVLGHRSWVFLSFCDNTWCAVRLKCRSSINRALHTTPWMDPRLRWVFPLKSRSIKSTSLNFHFGRSVDKYY